MGGEAEGREKAEGGRRKGRKNLGVGSKSKGSGLRVQDWKCGCLERVKALAKSQVRLSKKSMWTKAHTAGKHDGLKSILRSRAELGLFILDTEFVIPLESAPKFGRMPFSLSGMRDPHKHRRPRRHHNLASAGKRPAGKPDAGMLVGGRACRLDLPKKPVKEDPR